MSRRRSRRAAAGTVGTRPVGQPFLVVAGGSVPDAAFPVPPGTSYVGRGSDNEIVLPSGQVSRRHARLAYEHGRLTVEDLGSTNGTWLAGDRVEGPVALRPGDVVRLGDVRLRLELLDTEETGRPAGIPGGTEAAAVTVPTQRAVPAEEELAEEPPGNGARGGDAERRGAARKAWWAELPGKVKAVILTAGALAAAISAVLALWPKPPPPPSAEVRAVRLVSSWTPLSAYDIGALPLTAAEIPVPRQDTSAPAPVQPTASPAGPTGGTQTATEVPTAGPTVTPTGPTPASPTSEPTGGSAPSSPSGSLTGPPARGLQAPPLSSLGVGDVRTVMSHTGPLVADSLPDLAFPLATLAAQRPGTPQFQIAQQAATGPQDTVIPPQQVAKRIVAFLRDVRNTPVPGAGRHVQPVGAVLGIQLHLVGLRGQDVVVDWQLAPQTGAHWAYGGWLRRLVAYELRPSSDPADRIVPLWVPLPRQPGPYVVTVTVSTGDRAIAAGQSLPFG